MITAIDIGWLAGLFEGEGCFYHRRNGDLLAQVAMTDGDVIGRLQGILGFGTVKQRRLPSGKIAYQWSSGHQANTAGLMMTLLPLMGARRGDKIRECLRLWKKKPLPRGLLAHCKHGHELTGYNLVIVHEGKYVKRQCRICRRRRNFEYMARRKGAA